MKQKLMEKKKMNAQAQENNKDVRMVVRGDLLGARLRVFMKKVKENKEQHKL